MKRALQVVLFILSFIPLYFGVTGVMGGAAQFIPAENVVPALDNQFRYLSAFYIVLTLILWWIIPSIEKHTTLVRLISLALFIGGLARLYSYKTVGMPPQEMFAGMLLELGAPVLALWQAKIKTA